jgi:hypothetical protein
MNDRPTLETDAVFKLLIERDELRAEVESLKADKSRMDWLSKQAVQGRFYDRLNGTWRDSQTFTIHNSLRDAIDAAMKGDE